MYIFLEQIQDPSSCPPHFLQQIHFLNFYGEFFKICLAFINRFINNFRSKLVQYHLLDKFLIKITSFAVAIGSSSSQAAFEIRVETEEPIN